jgi:hypothetical protein
MVSSWDISNSYETGGAAAYLCRTASRLPGSGTTRVREILAAAEGG